MPKKAKAKLIRPPKRDRRRPRGTEEVKDVPESQSHVDVEHEVCIETPSAEVEDEVCIETPSAEVEDEVCSETPSAEVKDEVCIETPSAEVQDEVCIESPSTDTETGMESSTCPAEKEDPNATGQGWLAEHNYFVLSRADSEVEGGSELHDHDYCLRCVPHTDTEGVLKPQQEFTILHDSNTTAELDANTYGVNFDSDIIECECDESIDLYVDGCVNASESPQINDVDGVSPSNNKMLMKGLEGATTEVTMSVRNEDCLLFDTPRKIVTNNSNSFLAPAELLESVTEVSNNHTHSETQESGTNKVSSSSLDSDLMQCVTWVKSSQDSVSLGTSDPKADISNSGQDQANISTSVNQQHPPSSLASADLLKECVAKLESLLPALWYALLDDGLHVMKFSPGAAKTLQRSLYLRKDYKLLAHFHGKQLPLDHCYYEEVKKIDFEVNNADLLANAICRAVTEYRLYEVCCGVPSTKFKNLWYRDPECFIDMNPFHETRYQGMTCRSKSCSYAVPQLQRQCKTCNKVQKKFSSRSVFRSGTSPSNPKTPSKYKPYSNLITPEKKKRRELYKKHVRNLKRQNARLNEKIAKKVAEESVVVDEDFDRDLTSWIQEADQDNKILDVHKIFLQQQLQASKLNDKRGMRWHPLMIRFALLLKTLSDSAYSAMAQSGFIHLPCQKILYDYSHAMDVYEGCHPNIIEDVAKIVNASEHSYQHYHVLSFDEVTISQNLVTRKTSGEVIGYCKLDTTKSEMLQLEKKLKDTAAEVPATPVKEIPMVKKMLSFMVKGVANRVQSVVASFGVHLLSKEDLHEYVWEVVGNLEMCGVKICAFVCDGSPINRGFFEMQQPATINSESSNVFDTPNIYDPDRKIYFISDPPHLLKTMRNCLYNSGRKKCRELKKNGEVLKWNTIVQLYKWKSTQTVKKLFKLTAPCVFLNSWSRMKVALAARVLSLSVANVLKSLQWKGTSELSIFDKM